MFLDFLESSRHTFSLWKYVFSYGAPSSRTTLFCCCPHEPVLPSSVSIWLLEFGTLGAKYGIQGDGLQEIQQPSCSLEIFLPLGCQLGLNIGRVLEPYRSQLNFLSMIYFHVVYE